MTKHSLTRLTVILLLVGSLLFGARVIGKVWEVDDAGISVSAEHKLPTFDFTNLWFAGTLAQRGESALLHDAPSYREAMDAFFERHLSPHEWSYPPHLLLIAEPLSLLPLPVAYMLWGIGTWLFYAWSLTRFPLAWPTRMLLLAAPVVFINQAFGQNGCLLAALLLGGFALLPTRPILAGIFFGLLTIKPQIGLLIPIALLAGGQGRAILSAMLTFAVLVLLSSWRYGLESWVGFFTHTMPLMRAIMEAPYPQSYHLNATSIFVGAQRMGFSMELAYVLQGISALLCMVATWRLWRNPQAAPAQQTALTVLLIYLATPYAYLYDCVVVTAALALCHPVARRADGLWLSFYLLPVAWYFCPPEWRACLAVVVPMYLLAATVDAWPRQPGSQRPQ